jgi:hypothetical protein
VGTDNYEPLTFIENGWFHESYQNWLQGAVQHYLSMHAGVLADPVVAFTAPIDGTLMIHASKVTNIKEGGDGVRVKILKNDENVFPKEDWADAFVPGQDLNIPAMTFEVKKGDVIRFRLNCNQNQNVDSVLWERAISCLGDEAVAAPVEGVEFAQPENTTIAVTYNVEDGFSKNPGETPWGFEHAVVNTDNYEPLEFIQSGWYSERARDTSRACSMGKSPRGGKISNENV